MARTSWIVGAILLLHPPLPAQAHTGDAPLPVSMERIRVVLDRPPLLRLPAPSDDVPTFRVEVRGQLSLLPVDEEPFDPTDGLPSVGALLMGGIDKVRSAAVGYKRGRAQRRARKEVADALVAFCAVHECPSPGTST